MDNILQGIPGVMVYLDDILIIGSTVSDHLESLETVLDHLMKVALYIKKDTSTFLSSSVTYLGHKIDSKGLPPYEAKYTITSEMPDVIHQLWSDKIMPNLSSLLTSL